MSSRKSVMVLVLVLVAVLAISSVALAKGFWKGVPKTADGCVTTYVVPDASAPLGSACFRWAKLNPGFFNCEGNVCYLQLSADTDWIRTDEVEVTRSRHFQDYGPQTRGFPNPWVFVSEPFPPLPRYTVERHLSCLFIRSFTQEAEHDEASVYPVVEPVVRPFSAAGCLRAGVAHRHDRAGCQPGPHLDHNRVHPTPAEPTALRPYLDPGRAHTCALVSTNLAFATFKERPSRPCPPSARADRRRSRHVRVAFALSDDQRQRLAQDGFVVSPGAEKEFFTVYEKARYANVPIFVTSDSLLHVYHLLFDKVLRTAEVQYFIPLLRDLNAAVLDRTQNEYEALQGTPGRTPPSAPSPTSASPASCSTAASRCPAMPLAWWTPSWPSSTLQPASSPLPSSPASSSAKITPSTSPAATTPAATSSRLTSRA